MDENEFFQQMAERAQRHASEPRAGCVHEAALRHLTISFSATISQVCSLRDAAIDALARNNSKLTTQLDERDKLIAAQQAVILRLESERDSARWWLRRLAIAGGVLGALWIGLMA